MTVRRNVLLVVGLLVSIFFTYGSLIQAADVRGVAEKSIRIGFIIDLTGPAAGSVADVIKGFRTHVRYINEQGGIHGRKLQIFAEDDRFSIPFAISAFKKLVYRDRVFALAGLTSTGLLKPLMSKMEKEKLPTLSMVSPKIAVNPHKRYIFIAWDTYEGQARMLTDYVIKEYKLKDPRIGIVMPDNETGKTDLRAVLLRLKDYNIEPVTKEILMAGAMEASTQVMSLRRNGVNCIMHIGTLPQAAVLLLRELKKFGLKKPVFNSYAAMIDESLNEIGDAANQAYIIHSFSPWYGEGPGVEGMRNVTLGYYPGTERPYRGTSFAGGWAIASVLDEGLKRPGRNLDEDALIEALESFKNYDTGGLIPPVSYSSTSHKGGDSWKIYKADPVAGKYIAVTGWRKSD